MSYSNDEVMLLKRCFDGYILTRHYFKTDFQRHLIMADRAIDNMTSGFCDLKPIHIADCFIALSQGIFYSIFDTGCR